MNNFKNEKQKRQPHRSQLTRQILVQCIAGILGFTAVFALGILAAWKICASYVWYDTDPWWHVLTWIRDHIWIPGGIICFFGWLAIIYHFISKALRYLDEVISASGQLAVLSEVPIDLPPAMKQVQDELNLVREQALRNAMLAKEAEQRKNDLIVYLAHDLKTPLTSVIGYLTLLRDEPRISPELRAKYTGIALDKAERLEDLLNEFFDITRFNLTTMTLELENVNLSRMLEQIASEFLPILAEKELLWQNGICPDIEVVCDPDKMERVFDNLIRNAVNYSYHGTHIQLSLRQTADEIVICVRNQGKTISKEKLARIFEQFFRLDSSRASATGGAGLGLAISKEIVELHGGSIVAESADESIAFTVSLPFNCHKIV